MRLRRVNPVLLAATLMAFTAVPSAADVRFNLRATVSASCAIDLQTASRDGDWTVVDLEVLCNLSGFALAAPGARGVKLLNYNLLGASQKTPAIHEDGAKIHFSDMGPGRHLIRLRIAAPAGSTRLVLDTL